MVSKSARRRVSVYVTTRGRKVIAQAASLTGRSVNQFVAQAALLEAEKFVTESITMSLSARDAEIFFPALDNSPPVNERLATALLVHLQGQREVPLKPYRRVIGWKPKARQG